MSSLALYLIGVRGCGKTAVFDALTHTPAGPHFMERGGLRYGTVKVPDARLAALRDLYQPKKYTPAEVTFVDMPAPGNAEGHFGDQVGQLGNADAFVLVTQAFGDMDYRGNAVDPAAQLDSIMLELIVADLDKVERRLERVAQDQKRGQKISETELRVLERARELLQQDVPLRKLELREDEEKLLRTYQFLSQKPVVLVVNLAEDRLDGRGLESLADIAARRELESLRFCAPLEAEIAGLEPAEQGEFLKNYGLAEPARIRLIHSAYRALKLISFFTVGEDEVRAWTIPEGAKAQAAAGKIHSDIERGFIRAETVAADTLLATGSWAKCREHGTLKLEGKEYAVRDGDVINFRFNA